MLTIQNPKRSQLAQKPAYSFVDNVSLGLHLPPSSSGCLSPQGDGLQLAISVQFFFLCTGLAVSQVRAGFARGSYPTVWFASPSQFAQIALGAFRPDPYSKQCSLHLRAQPPLASGGCRHLRCFSAVGVTVGLVICEFYLFIFPPCYVALCASKAHHRLSSESISWCLETSLFLRLPSRDRALSLPLLSLFLSFIFFPTSFQRQWAAFLGSRCPLPAFRSCFVEFTQRLNVLLMNQLWRNWSPHPIPPPSQDCLPRADYLLLSHLGSLGYSISGCRVGHD